MQKSLNVLALTIGVSLVAALSAKAQLIANESFNYAAQTGGISGSGAAGGGWAGAWTDKGSLTAIAASGLSYTDGSGNTLTTSGNSLLAQVGSSTASSTEPERQLTSTFGTLANANSDTLWMSFLWLGLNTSSTSGGLYRQSSLMLYQGVTSTSGSGKEFLDIGMPNISSANESTVNPNISLWTANGNAGQSYTSTAPLQSTVAANNGTTDFILIEMTSGGVAWATGGSETINIWINPTLGGTLGTADITYSAQDLSGINGFRIQAGGYNATYGTVGGAEEVDEINIGDTMVDVEPVPEPASLSLAALGGLALLALKRKQR